MLEASSTILGIKYWINFAYGYEKRIFMILIKYLVKYYNKNLFKDLSIVKDQR